MTSLINVMERVLLVHITSLLVMFHMMMHHILFCFVLSITLDVALSCLIPFTTFVPSASPMRYDGMMMPGSCIHSPVAMTSLSVLMPILALPRSGHV